MTPMRGTTEYTIWSGVAVSYSGLKSKGIFWPELFTGSNPFAAEATMKPEAPVVRSSTTDSSPSGVSLRVTRTRSPCSRSKVLAFGVGGETVQIAGARICGGNSIDLYKRKIDLPGGVEDIDRCAPLID